jgi:hypothetical protein
LRESELPNLILSGSQNYLFTPGYLPLIFANFRQRSNKKLRPDCALSERSFLLIKVDAELVIRGRNSDLLRRRSTGAIEL